MDGSKEMLIRMREEDYASLNSSTRQKFLSEKVIIHDEHQKLYDTDERYRQLYKLYKDAKLALERYKFNKRHANNGSDTK